jgi:hypothetical protein
MIAWLRAGTGMGNALPRCITVLETFVQMEKWSSSMGFLSLPAYFTI